MKKRLNSEADGACPPESAPRSDGKPSVIINLPDMNFGTSLEDIRERAEEFIRSKKQAVQRALTPLLRKKPKCGEGEQLVCCKYETGMNRVEFCNICEEIFFSFDKSHISL